MCRCNLGTLQSEQCIDIFFHVYQDLSGEDNHPVAEKLSSSTFKTLQLFLEFSRHSVVNCNPLPFCHLQGFLGGEKHLICIFTIFALLNEPCHFVPFLISRQMLIMPMKLTSSKVYSPMYNDTMI